MLREVPMNARVYIGLKLLFANGVGSQEAVISKNFQYKKIFQNLEQIQPKSEIMHQYTYIQTCYQNFILSEN